LTKFMSQALAISQFACPGCDAILATPAQGTVRCSACQWQGDVFLFWRIPVNSATAESALPEDATCIHHPRKKATATCAGTGDYICSLCAVELNGQVYSAQYLDKGGKEKLGSSFERYLPRPDSQIGLYLLLSFIPYVNVAAIPFAFLWIPHGFVLYFRALRLRRENPLYRRLIGVMTVVIYPILLGLFAVGWLAGVVALLYVLTSKGVN
jgi:hypothetical protein